MERTPLSPTCLIPRWQTREWHWKSSSAIGRSGAVPLDEPLEPLLQPCCGPIAQQSTSFRNIRPGNRNIAGLQRLLSRRAFRPVACSSSSTSSFSRTGREFPRLKISKWLPVVGCGS